MVHIVEFIKDIFKYLVIIGIIVLIRIFIITTTEVVGTSMMPTLNDGDFMLVEQVKSRLDLIERFQIIVIKYSSPSFLIKRVIGLPGETIEYSNNILYVNGIIVEETFDTIGVVENFKITVPNDEYFVLGDNRNDSIDSRIFGTIKKENIIGSPFLTMWPFKNFGLKK